MLVEFDGMGWLSVMVHKKIKPFDFYEGKSLLQWANQSVPAWVLVCCRIGGSIEWHIKLARTEWLVIGQSKWAYLFEFLLLVSKFDHKNNYANLEFLRQYHLKKSRNFLLMKNLLLTHEEDTLIKVPHHHDHSTATWIMLDVFFYSMMQTKLQKTVKCNLRHQWS